MSKKIVKLQTPERFPVGADRTILAMSAAELKAASTGRTKRAEQVRAEIARRAANRAIKAANRKAIREAKG